VKNKRSKKRGEKGKKVFPKKNGKKNNKYKSFLKKRNTIKVRYGLLILKTRISPHKPLSPI